MCSDNKINWKQLFNLKYYAIHFQMLDLYYHHQFNSADYFSYQMQVEALKKTRLKFYQLNGDFKFDQVEASAQFNYLVRQQQQSYFTCEENRRYAQERLQTIANNEKNGQKSDHWITRQQKRTVGWLGEQLNHPQKQKFNTATSPEMRQFLKKEQQHFGQLFMKDMENKLICSKDMVDTEMSHPQNVQVYDLINILSYSANQLLDISENFERELQLREHEENNLKKIDWEQSGAILRQIFQSQMINRKRILREGWPIYEYVAEFNQGQNNTNYQQFNPGFMRNQDPEQRQ